MWIVSCFFLLKRLYIKRNKIESALRKYRNLFGLPHWEEFVKTKQYNDFLD